MAETQIDDPTQAPAIERLLSPRRLPWKRELETTMQIDELMWRVFTDAIWPSAETAEAILLAVRYCRAKRVDPMMKVVHIVPIYSTVLKKMVESVWPGIALHRITAHRTGQYVGRKFTVGPLIPEFPTAGDPMLNVPEWYQCDVKRLVAGQERTFEGERVYFEEAYARVNRNSDSPNAMWFRRPHGQLHKCSEAASLRGAFPEETGGEYTSEEMEGKEIATLVGSPMIEAGSAGAGELPQQQIEEQRPIVIQTGEPKQADTISVNLGVNEAPKEGAQQQGDPATLTAHTGKPKPAGSTRKKGAKDDAGPPQDPPPAERDDRAGDPPTETQSPPPPPPPPAAQQGRANDEDFADLLSGKVSI